MALQNMLSKAPLAFLPADVRRKGVVWPLSGIGPSPINAGDAAWPDLEFREPVHGVTLQHIHREPQFFGKPCSWASCRCSGELLNSQIGGHLSIIFFSNSES